MIKKVGFIGLGIMGKPMALNLLNGGYELTVFDVAAEPMQALVKAGARPASSPREVAGQAELIISILPSHQVVEEVVLGRDGVLPGLKPGGIMADMSTLSPSTPRKINEELKKIGAYMLDAPVSGGEIGAIEASLSIMVGGDRQAFDTALPVFQKIGKNINYLGESGAGQIAKCANQIIVSLTIGAVTEALLMAQKAGADPVEVRKALLGGFAHSRILEVSGQKILDRNFKPGARISIHKKDTEIAMGLAAELGLYLPGTALMSQLWNAASAQDNGADRDHSYLIEILEMMSNSKAAARVE